jgi:septum formation protein
MKNILYLASKSASRKMLLQKAGIQFQILEQDADESQCDWGMPLHKVVESIALHKMNHVIMPPGKEGQIAFVVTADTLSVDTTGAIRGKPVDKADALNMLHNARGTNNLCGTAFCLDKKIYQAGQWHTQKRIQGYAQALYTFDIPDSCIDDYIRHAEALNAAGAIKIEDGAQFVQTINGSYTAIVGLPMFELWQALREIGFY